MKHISLNIWGGTIHEAFLAFVEKHAADTDIFCFQEAYSSPRAAVSNGLYLDIFEELSGMLPQVQSFFS
ncbi:MAG: hypothetical protein AAB967_01725, partial [Patescibacteria group bacterium]